MAKRAVFPRRFHATWQDGLIMLLALWLFLSPWLVEFAAVTAAAWNAWLVAVLMGGFLFTSLQRGRPWGRVATVVLGFWLIVSPWLLNVEAVPQRVYWNLTLVGLAAAILGAWTLIAGRAERR